MALFDVIGQRWTLRIMWELHERAPLTFRELQQHCGGLSSSVLIGRLDVLREVRLVTAGPDGYRLTEQGATLTTHLLPLSHWAEQWASELVSRSSRPGQGSPGSPGPSPRRSS